MQVNCLSHTHTHESLGAYNFFNLGANKNLII
jgi:hypothetical protein